MEQSLDLDLKNYSLWFDDHFYQMLWKTFIISAILTIVFLLWYFYKRFYKKRPMSYQKNEQKKLIELEKLLKRSEASSCFKEFYLTIIQIIREHLAYYYRIPYATEQECLASLDALSLEKEQVIKLKEIFLCACKAKYSSDYQPNKDELYNALAAAKQFVQLVQSSRACPIKNKSK